MQTYQPSNFARNDTLLGVCQSIGEDLGFNPLYLRVVLATLVFFNLGAAVGIYLAMGAVVLATRLLPESRNDGARRFEEMAACGKVEAVPRHGYLRNGRMLHEARARCRPAVRAIRRGRAGGR